MLSLMLFGSTESLDFFSLLVFPNVLSCISEINLEFKTIPNSDTMEFTLILYESKAVSLVFLLTKMLSTAAPIASARRIPVSPIDC